MANTKSITDKTERKKVKRAARKKAAPKAKRTGSRGENKAKVKKAVARPVEAVSGEIKALSGANTWFASAAWLDFPKSFHLRACIVLSG